MPAVRRNRATEAIWSLHKRVYRASGGRLFGSIAGMRVLVLTTIGRRSGAERSTALMHFRDDGRYIVTASNAGEPRDPAWWLNLEARPQARIEVGREQLEVRAREAEAEERERLWQRLIEINPDYETYQQRTQRRLPLVVLEPSSGSD